MTDPSPSDVALELERLRGAVEAGFARLDGRLDLLTQRHDQTDERLDELESRVDALEDRRWPLPSIGAVTGLVGVTAAVISQLR
ncbi:hypothetical protein [Streptomyces sp. BK239]|uniref:hypothetical protein n=1 Tax=Streptomyces sp. BK239 TaxID=2512155 RepID=UPI00102C7D38|nr:hypothetical protein [Streptomyces sp. BK239]RZU21750.1 hypothetical protein EV567_2255 [Streptomyces sp. BK239]